MDFFEVLDTRHSVRTFAGRPLENEKLQRILEAANMAPSAGNLQAYEIYVATHTQRKHELSKAAHDQEFIRFAGAVLVFCANPVRSSEKYGERGAQLYCIQDATIACTYAMLAAAALGLASVWIGSFDSDKILEAMDAPAGTIPVAMLPIGYAGEIPERTTRRELANIVQFMS